MSMRVYLDFEYNRTTAAKLNLVCVAWEVWNNGNQVSAGGNLWLDSASMQARENFRTTINRWHDNGATFVAYAVTAEARSLLSLDVDVLKLQWVDLYLEYRQLLNHNHEYAYGKQLQRGKVKWIMPPVPKAFRVEEDGKRSGKPEYNLAAACYKLLGVMVDTEHKGAMRDLIISAP